jgi:hypothetical protein
MFLIVWLCMLEYAGSLIAWSFAPFRTEKYNSQTHAGQKHAGQKHAGQKTLVY